MRIVTPYGRSHTEPRRVLRLKPLLTEQRQIPAFAQDDDRLGCDEDHLQIKGR